MLYFSNGTEMDGLQDELTQKFLAACSKGDYETLESVIKQSTSTVTVPLDLLQAKNTKGFTGLDEALMLGQMDSIVLILEHGKIQIDSQQMRSVLFPAICSVGDIQIVVKILEMVSEEELLGLLKTVSGGKSALDWAIQREHLDLCKVMLEHAMVKQASGLNLLAGLFPCVGMFSDVGLAEKILDSSSCEDQKTLLRAQTKKGRTAISVACRFGHEKVVLYLLECSKHCGIQEEMILQARVGPNWSSLHYACYKGHNHCINAVLESVPKGLWRQLMHSKDSFGMTPLHLCVKYHAGCCSVHLLSHLGCNELRDLLYMRDMFGNQPLAYAEKSTLDAFISHELGHSHEGHEPLPLMTICAIKNKFGFSYFHYEDKTSKSLKVLNQYMKKHLHFDRTLHECFPEICRETKSVSCSHAARDNPLTVIGETGNMALISHPYIQTYLNACWTSFVRYIFYTDLTLYLVFFGLLCSFVSSHRFVKDMTPSNDTTISNEEHEPYVLSESLEPPLPIFSEICRGGTMVLAIFALIFEGLQMKTKKRHYFTHMENYGDLSIFIGALTITIFPLCTGHYTALIHAIGCILIVCSAIRASWTLSHVPYIGGMFRMLFAIVWKVFIFSPVLLFFVLTFALIMHNLLHNQEPFSHIGLAVMKTMAMTVGELDFGAIFFDHANHSTFEIMAFIIFDIFLVVMTISMMNLLIGIAVGDISDLSKEGEQSKFRSKVDLVLQFSYMFPGISGRMHKRKLCDLMGWRPQNVWKYEEWFETENQEVEDKFLEYMGELESWHNLYAHNHDGCEPEGEPSHEHGGGHEHEHEGGHEHGGGHERELKGVHEHGGGHEHEKGGRHGHGAGGGHGGKEEHSQEHGQGEGYTHSHGHEERHKHEKGHDHGKGHDHKGPSHTGHGMQHQADVTKTLASVMAQLKDMKEDIKAIKIQVDKIEANVVL